MQVTRTAETGLVKYDAMTRAIAEAHAVDEVKDIRDKARALEVYAHQATNLDAEEKAAEIRIRAERRTGQLLKASRKGQGRRTDLVDRHDQVNGSQTLDDIGVTKDQSSKWQKLSEVPRDKFERYLSEPGVPTTAGALAASGDKPEKPVEQKPTNPHANNTLWVWGRMRDCVEHFESFTAAQCAEGCINDQVMRPDLKKTVPAVIAWLEELRSLL